MKKKLLGSLLIVSGINAFASNCPPSANELCDYSYGTFYHLNNVFGINAVGVSNFASFSNQSQLGGTNANGLGLGGEAYLSILLTNGIWINNDILYVNYLGAGNYAADQANYTLKVGYGFQPIYDYWQITPYIVGGLGAGQLNWDNQINYGVGAGLKTEVAFTTRNSLYVDYNYQYIIQGSSFTNSFNNQFNTVATSINNPIQQTAEIGFKHVFDCSVSMQVYYKNIQDTTGFMINNATNNYTNNSQIFGIGVNWYIGN
ncbi:MAG: hypothetical protein K2P99_01160 [Burkholderiales bacterium]|nr:hypothetical protein [Burkholderiales bacterium]